MKTRKLVFSLFILWLIIANKVFTQVQPVKVDLISNGCKLNAEIYQCATKKPISTLILMHGYPGGEGDPLGLGKKLSSLGINVFVFNYRGTWSSEGEFSFENSMEDIGSAIGFLKRYEIVEKFGIDPSNIVVGGYSFGGAMALTAAIYNKEIRKIISIAGPDESIFGRKMLTDQNFRNMFVNMLKETEYPKGPIKYNLESYMKFFLSNLDKYDLLKHSESFENKEILLLSGLNDSNVILEEHILPFYRKIQKLNSDQIELIIFNTDHSFKNVKKELSNKIFAWLTKKD